MKMRWPPASSADPGDRADLYLPDDPHQLHSSGLRREKLPILTVIIGGITKIVMNYVLVGNPSIGIKGAPISTLCCYLVIVVLNLFFVWKYSPQKPRYLQILRSR